MEIFVVLERDTIDIESCETTIKGAKYDYGDALRLIEEIKDEENKNRPSKEVVDEFHRRYNEYILKNPLPTAKFATKSGYGADKSEVDSYMEKVRKIHQDRAVFLKDLAFQMSEGRFDENQFTYPREVSYEVVPTNLT